ncbi:MAG: acyltransferase [Pseudomonadota bacterium]
MIANIQLLRAVAAWMVVAHHLRDGLSEIWLPLGALVFASGVDLFFVISGFVMVVSTEGRNMSPMAFWRRRLVRVVPLYWLVTAAMLAMLLAGLNPVGVTRWDWGDALTSFLFLADVRADTYPGPIVAVGWTLVFEAFFYGIFGAALVVRNHINPACVVCSVMAVLVAAGLILTPENHALQIYTAPLLLEFAVGALIAKLVISKMSAPSALRSRPSALVVAGSLTVLLGVVLAMAGGGVLSAMAPDYNIVDPALAATGWRAVFFGGPAVLVVLGAVALDRSGVTCRAGFWMTQGAASYALYLTHQIVMQMLEKGLGDGWLAALITIPVLGAVAVAVHLGMEKPVTAWLSAPRFRLQRLPG